MKHYVEIISGKTKVLEISYIDEMKIKEALEKLNIQEKTIEKVLENIIY